MQLAVFEHPPLLDHALLDSGEGEKLERFGEVVLARPDPQALWKRRLGAERWRRADLVFVRESDRGGRWERGAEARGRAPAAEGAVAAGAARVLGRPAPLKHVGLFPEQAANWRWVERLRAALGDGTPRLLNLFAYTGAASVLAARAGFAVTHVDASRASLAWTRDNAAANGLAPDALRLVLDDALAFTRREARRGGRYDGVLIDPPHYGRGPRGERWQFETGIAPLLATVGELLAERAFLVLSTYAIGYSPLAFVNMLAELEGGEVEAGELALPEEDAGPDLPARRLPCGFCARWWRAGSSRPGAGPPERV
jgi:23S rRNA (cytosine1962-C5)-methyltransferase